MGRDYCLRGVSELSDKWWLNYRFDIGAGGSDLTWNAVAQFGYTYDWGGWSWDIVI
jgi:hypothetical protein